MTVNEKLKKEEAKLEALKSQRNSLDEKIRGVEKEIEKCNVIIKQQIFSEADQVLVARGLSIEEIMNAIKSGDLLSLQQRMDDMSKEKGKLVS